MKSVPLKVVCVAYVLALLYLLMTGEPVASLVAVWIPVGSYEAIVVAAHVTSFAILSLLLWATRFPARIGQRLRLLVVCAVGLEFAQGLTLTRTPDVLDGVCNLGGVAAGSLAFVMLRRTRRGRPGVNSAPGTAVPARDTCGCLPAPYGGRS